MSFIHRIQALASRIGRETEQPPVVECHLHGHGEDEGVVAGRGFLVISGFLGQAEYDKISAAASDMIAAGVRRVGILIDSGGGHMAGVDGAVKALVELRSSVNDDLHTLAEGMAASSAYALLACGGRGKIHATAGAQVGSIGPKIRLEDSSRLWTEGMLTTVHEITDGQPLKPVGAPGHPIDAEAIDFERDQVAAAKQIFFQLIAAVKRVPVVDIARAAAKGGTYQASVALDLGLVDKITDKISFVAIVNGADSLPPPSLEVFPMADNKHPAETPPVESAASPPHAVPRLQVEGQADGRPVPAILVKPAAKPPVQTVEESLVENYASQVHTAMGEDFASQMATLTSVVTDLAKSQEAMAASIAADSLARSTAQVDAAIATARARVEACVPRITRSAADGALTAVETTIRAGADPAALIVSLEAMPAIDASSDLTAEVTIAGAGQEAQDVTFDLSYFSSPGKNGLASIPPAVKERSTQALAAVAGLPGNPGEANGRKQRIRAYSALYEQHGFLPGRRT